MAKPTLEQPESEKLQKVLAELGHGSRREMEQWISKGRVEVNGEVAHLGQRITSEDQIRLDGKAVTRRRRAVGRVIVYNKPAGIICTRRDPEGRQTVFDKLSELKKGRWISIGRLDIATTGLLLLTNDGALANRMMHPSTGLDREYAVRVNGQLRDDQLKRLIAGIDDDGDHLAFSDIRYYDGSGTNHWYHVVLLEGKNREIRRLFEHLGLVVSRLKRVRFGPVLLPPRLARGRSEEMAPRDVAALYKLLKLPIDRAELRRGRTHKGTRTKDQQKSRKRSSVLIAYPDVSD